MGNDNQRFEPESFERLLDELVCLNATDSSPIELKIDALEHVLAYLRFKNRHITNKMKFEDFRRSDVFVDRQRLFCLNARHSGPMHAGTPPLNLQPMLLMFLLLYHKESYRIYDIISKFIDRIWDTLEPEDFKRTETGVLRCFTNTRFAARTLRQYGFLKFTQKEAYKTWTLSLHGCVIASIFLNQTGLNFRHFSNSESLGSFLHPDIQKAYASVKDFAGFVKVLEWVCRPNTKVFSTFGTTLEKAHSLLGRYWAALNKATSVKERKNISTWYVSQLEKIPEMDRFYFEFCRSVTVDRLLSEAE
jgi:hypothetical protein